MKIFNVEPTARFSNNIHQVLLQCKSTDLNPHLLIVLSLGAKLQLT